MLYTIPKIVCDSHIPFIVEALRKEWENVSIYPMEPEKIDTSAVHDADILIVRTRTKVDEHLLKGSNVQLVCTATIGFDHIDTSYCESRGIRWLSCPGCNAQAVCDYIEEAIDEFVQTASPTLPLTIGIVGIGHVGSKVAEMAERKGMKVLLNDPPRGIGVSLDKIGRNSDIITFHVPLTKYPHQYPTFHLCDESLLNLCKPGALIINAARGGVLDEEAMLRSGLPFIIDTWEGEPDINPAVLNGAFRASMHIAGYSVEGKRMASQMCLDEIARMYGLSPVTIGSSTSTGDTAYGWLERITRQLQSQPERFEALRKNYTLR